jgi:predicted phosphoribosyltransferase
MNRGRFADRFPDLFVAVGLWFDEFAQTTDEQVQALLGA